MNKQPFKALALALFAFALPVVAQEATDVQVQSNTEVKDVLKAGASKVSAAQKAQINVDRIADQTDGLIARIQTG